MCRQDTSFLACSVSLAHRRAKRETLSNRNLTLANAGGNLTALSSNFAEAIRYISRGEHAFVAIDCEHRREAFVQELNEALSGQPCVLIDGQNAVSGRPFARALIQGCDQLVESIGIGMEPDNCTVSGHLLATMRLFQAQQQQGYLVFNSIDPMIQSQTIFEIEGALRSAMQHNDHVAVVLCGSEATINEMGGSDRPFYCSFRAFRLNEGD